MPKGPVDTRARQKLDELARRLHRQEELAKEMRQKIVALEDLTGLRSKPYMEVAELVQKLERILAGEEVLINSSPEGKLWPHFGHEKIDPEARIRDIVAQLALEGLVTDGAHHKQWFLEQILETMGVENIPDHDPGVPA
jgi:hypothetical protein